jgi:hypothetical protein
MIWVVRVRYARVMNPDHGNRGCPQDQISVLIIREPHGAEMPVDPDHLQGGCPVHDHMVAGGQVKPHHAALEH